MKKIIITLILILVLKFNCWGADKGRTGGVVLTYPVGARAVGMGGAFVAVADDISAVGWNPAGISFITNRELMFYYLEGLADTNFSFISYGFPTKVGILGMSLSSFQAGKIQIYDEVSLIKEVNAEADYLLCFSYGNKISDIFSLGMNIKGLQSNLAETETATAYALDCGVIYTTPLNNLLLGMVIQNAGTKIKYINEKDPLPMVTKIGLAYTLYVEEKNAFSSQLHTFTIAIDEEKPNYDIYMTNIGLEYWYSGIFSLRTGYKINRDNQSYSVGVGWNYEGVEFDYAFAPVSDLESNHRVSLLIKF